MEVITVFYNDRKVELYESSPSLESKIETGEIEEPVIYKCSEKMINLLDLFFENNEIEKISFEHFDLEKLFNDFKTNFKIIEAAGGIVRNNNNDLLVIHRFGKIDLPKGKMETDESFEKAALREVSEECGIKNMRILNAEKPTYHMYILNGKKCLKVTHWFNMNYSGNEELVPQKEEGILDVRWVNENEIDSLQNSTYASLKHFFKTK